MQKFYSLVYDIKVNKSANGRLHKILAEKEKTKCREEKYRYLIPRDWENLIRMITFRQANRIGALQAQSDWAVRE